MHLRPAPQRRTIDSEQASPADTTVRRAGKLSGSKISSNEGGKVRVLIDSSRKNWSNSGPSQYLSRFNKTSVAPATNAVKISDTEASKEMEANWSTRLSGVISKSRIC